MAYVLAYLFHNWELFALRSWIVAFLVYAQGLQPDASLGKAWSATTIAALVNMTGLPASVLGNEASRRFGRRRVVIWVMLGSALFACTLGFLAPIPFVALVALCFVYNLTVTGDSASITAGAVAASAAGERGATMAVHSFIGFSGAFVGPLAFGVVLDLAGNGEALAWGLAFVSSGLAVALGPLAVVALTRRAPPASSEH
jgi:MFS family permease